MPPRWYRHVMRVLSESHVVLDVRDVRYPEETRWERLAKLEDVFDFSRVVVLNKTDLVPLDEAKRVKRRVEREENVPAVYVSARERMGIRYLRRTIHEMAPEDADPIRVGVVGVQNVGKSTVINALTGRSAAGVSRRAGHTRGKQWVRGGRRLLVIDSPGVVPADEAIAEAVALDPDVLEDPVTPALRVVERVTVEYPGALSRRFGVDETAEPIEILRDVANVLGKDMDTTARFLLRQWVDGRLVEEHRTTKMDSIVTHDTLKVGGTAQRLVEETLEELKEIVPADVPPSAAIIRSILVKRAHGQEIDGVGLDTTRLNDYGVGISLGDRYYDRMVRLLRRELEGDVIAEERFRVGINHRKAVVMVTLNR